MNFIPFQERFIQQITEGAKDMTCRTRKYGEPGDLLRGPHGIVIQLLEVRRVRLDDVATHHYLNEGCKTAAEFVQVWETIHPRRGYDPEQRVWLHIFRLVPAAMPP